MYHILNRIQSPADLRGLSVGELERLCREIRHKIIHVVAKNGGHLASNLGVVDLTVALHRVFDLPTDQIVWDVGHQSYTHKILTGRLEQMDTIRTQDGLSGYPDPAESPYDSFRTGHSSTSISAALGIAEAKKLKREPGHVLAVIGDGALTGGLAYEGLNNAGHFPGNFIVVLNDNNMSISRNVGSISRHLSALRTTPGYLKAKGELESALDHLPLLGSRVYRVIRRSKSLMKRVLYNSTIFEDMGFTYYGPFDGHNMQQLLEVFQSVKDIQHPILLHVLTKKGRGYPFAEQDPGVFHGVSGFDVKTGQGAAASENFSSVFGRLLCGMAEKDSTICAITAAMQEGTALTGFANRFPERFFDVGIAEQHAITFAGGLASAGMLPVCAIYSTFLQRGFDQIIHDAALQNVKVVLAIDRAGVVGEDGETHQGIFDASFLNSVPNVTVYSPSYYDELEHALTSACYQCGGVAAVRYPRGKEAYRPEDFTSSFEAFDCYGEEDADCLLVTYGRLFSYACKAKETLSKQGVSVRILKLNRIKPIDPDAITLAAKYPRIFFFEEGMRQGGIGEHFYSLLGEYGFAGVCRIYGISRFIKQATVPQSLAALGLDDAGMVETIRKQNGAEKHE